MFIKRFSIRRMLLVTAIALAGILLSIGFITNYFIKKSFIEFELVNEIERIHSMALQVRNYEKDFLLREITNPTFFETGKSKYLDLFDSLSNKIVLGLANTKGFNGINSLNLDPEFDRAQRSFNEYRATFNNVASLIRDRGLTNTGLIGQFRNSIHNVESQLNAMKNYYYSTQMLTLRRHEKDYLLRKDLDYQKKFHATLQNFIFDIKKSPNQNKVDELTSLLTNYGDVFNKLIEMDRKLGFNEQEGLLGTMNSKGEQLEKSLLVINNTLFENSKHKVQAAVYTLFGIVGIISIFAISLLLLVSDHIVKSIKHLKQYITRLGKGELPNTIVIKGKNEIAQMEKSINVLTENLKNTRHFAIEVGNGNLESEVNVFGNKGDLGGALIEMRKKLLQVATEREQQAMETSRRMWVNEGMAIFAELLRVRDKSIEDFSFEIIKRLVKYTKSNQAGIYLMETSDDGRKVLRMITAYAYERRKFVDTVIHLNEGLVGMCAMEAETTIFTDIPNDYLKITSGLGDANPTCLILIPLKINNEVFGVIEMASFKIYQKFEIEFIERISESLASTLQMVNINNHTQKLLAQTSQQAQALQEHEEEMRQNMEELQATQEWMMKREEELKNLIVQKENEIIRLNLEISPSNVKDDGKYSDIKSMYEIFNSHFITAELNQEGDILISNSRFTKILGENESKEFNNIFDNSLPGEESINKQDWHRIINGETYRGVIHRIDSTGNYIALQTVISPIINEAGVIEMVLFIAQKIGLIDERISERAEGSWSKDFISGKSFYIEAEKHCS
jgi:PAS domain-containing protein